MDYFSMAESMTKEKRQELWDKKNQFFMSGQKTRCVYCGEYIFTQDDWVDVITGQTNPVLDFIFNEYRFPKDVIHIACETPGGDAA